MNWTINEKEKVVNWSFISLMVIISGCGVYTLSGATLSPDIQTISIQSFYNDSNGGPPNMGQLFTNQIRDYFQQNASLSLTPDEGHLQLEGSVTGYRLSPVAATAAQGQNLADASALTRLTITIKVSYVDITNEENEFNRTFSFFEDFDNTRDNLSAIEDELLSNIFEQIILDIFNATVANW